MKAIVAQVASRHMVNLRVANVARKLQVTIKDMETDLRRRKGQSMSPKDANMYISDLEAHAQEVEDLDPKVARSIRSTKSMMVADINRRGEVEASSLQSYIENLKADLARL